MARPTFKDFKEKALSDANVRSEYDGLDSTFELKRQLIAIRKASGLTQAQLAAILNTQKQAITRIESMSSRHSPTMTTIRKYAEACGYRAEIRFERV
jgi:DNA-binding XRE family transcriptional regulator